MIPISNTELAGTQRNMEKGTVNDMVPGEFPTQSPVTRSFDVFFDLSLKWLSKQSWS